MWNIGLSPAELYPCPCIWLRWWTAHGGCGLTEVHRCRFSLVYLLSFFRLFSRLDPVFCFFSCSVDQPWCYWVASSLWTSSWRRFRLRRRRESSGMPFEKIQIWIMRKKETKKIEWSIRLTPIWNNWRSRTSIYFTFYHIKKKKKWKQNCLKETQT